ncbi:leucine-rich repeat-containing protein 59 [Spea bombifrons]|uniref:leucine-rich repeat-containing protein 59 n=1 Tax=Spea bombifrons TaxID=233779 RepID=UPI00234B398B|nr:leucine-rich repeat-containing protein 59 [Spea bombifrons]
MSRGASKLGNLKDKLDGNELDLSLSDMSEIPVRELAAIPKATVLDLSCNKLTALPGDFCSLIHIVKLDLSKNLLVQLPSEFGRLINLQHLDLLQNRLTVLPVTFAYLKNLKWLDLKDNPLNPALAKVAGDCLDEKQCKECAQGVLQYMKIVQSDLEKEMQRKLLMEQAQKQKHEAEQQQREERQRQLRRREKARQKDKKRRDYNALQAAQRQVKNNTENEKSYNHKVFAIPIEKKQQQRQSWLGRLVVFILFMLMMAIGIVVICHCTQLQTKNICFSINAVYEETLTTLRSYQILEGILQPPGPQQEGH